MARRSDIDWEAIETAYRISQFSIRQIAEQHSTEASTITRRAKKHGWERDLSQAVAAATKTKVRNAVIVAAQQNATECTHQIHSTVDLAATANALLMGRHQARAGRLSSLLEKLTGEMEEVASDPQSLESIALALEESDPKSAEAVNRLRTLTSRMNNLKTAGEILAKLVPIERQAFGIDEEGKGGGSLEDTLAKIEKAEAGE